VANGLIDESGELSASARQLREIEHAVDITDRVMNEVSSEEFGRPMFPTSENLTGVEQEMARELEAMYERITKHLWYSNRNQ
jgi:hypothetical protein